MNANSLTVEVVAIGSELLLGQTVDTNSSWIGQELAAAGINSHFQTKVGDNRGRLKSVLEQALSRSDAVICCGGLGPTQDDLTREIIAEVMGVELVLEQRLVTKIEAMFGLRNRKMPSNNLAQAMVPVGATTIPEQPGTAPGLICPVGDGLGVLYAVPGVPYEMKEMITKTVIPDLASRSGEKAVIGSRILRTWGLSESVLAELLADRIVELDAVGNPTLAFMASGVEGMKVRITARASDSPALAEILDSEEQQMRAIFGEYIFAVDGQNMEAVVIEALKNKGLKLAVAESVTGGYVSGRLCAAPGASEVYKGAVVAYHSGVKFSLLDVERGPVVSTKAALAMAEGVRRVLDADIGIAATGVAGPETVEDLAVGTVCLAVEGVGISESRTVTMPGDRERIRQFSTITLLDLLRRQLL